MGHTVYILEDENGDLYKGLTNDIDRRLKEHRRGKTVTTRRMSRLRLIHSERYETFKEARKREKYFKSAAGRGRLKIILGN
jgi:putative endonuclease